MGMLERVFGDRCSSWRQLGLGKRHWNLATFLAKAEFRFLTVYKNNVHNLLDDNETKLLKF